MIDLNVAALTRLMHHALPGMLARGRGGILNVASLGGLVPGPYQAAYYASKAYVISLTEAVGSEAAGQGVRLTALAPGPVDTGFHAAMGSEFSFYRQLILPLSPEGTANAAYRGYVLGCHLVVPGLINKVLALALRILPHTLLLPFVGWLLRPAEQRPWHDTTDNKAKASAARPHYLCGNAFELKWLKTPRVRSCVSRRSRRGGAPASSLKLAMCAPRAGFEKTISSTSRRTVRIGPNGARPPGARSEAVLHQSRQMLDKRGLAP